MPAIGHDPDWTLINPETASRVTEHTGRSDYEMAFRTVGRAKRSLVVVFTDLFEEAAAQPLLEAMPVKIILNDRAALYGPALYLAAVQQGTTGLTDG